MVAQLQPTPNTKYETLTLKLLRSTLVTISDPIANFIFLAPPPLRLTTCLPKLGPPLVNDILLREITFVPSLRRKWSAADPGVEYWVAYLLFSCAEVDETKSCADNLLKMRSQFYTTIPSEIWVTTFALLLSPNNREMPRPS